MKNLYKDVKTGELMLKVTDWEIQNGDAHAYFKVESGAIFSMIKCDVVKVS